MTHQLDTLEALRAYIHEHGNLRGEVVQDLDLREHGELLRSISGERATFLGCTLDPDTVVHLVRTGAELFPPLGESLGLPYRAYRSDLYTVEELYEGFDPAVEGSFWTAARDTKIYAQFKQLHDRDEPVSIVQAMAMRLHDHAIEDALNELLRGTADTAPKRVVAVMGGHAMRRDEPIYTEVAHMARSLTRAGYFVATGGGPGAMEAANLGAYLSTHDDAALDEAIAILAGETAYAEHRYLELALEVRRRWPAEGSGESLAIPTWFYGHEPSNMFAAHIAKYFANSVREDGLLAIATHGVIYAPGSAGTVQEVFMDACQNHYVVFGQVSPMVLLGVEHWTERLPVWPLLQKMSAGEPWGEVIHLCDDGREAATFIVEHPPAET